jgi:hypothetical protein
MKYFYSYYPTKIIDDESVLFNLLSIKLSSILLQKENKKVIIWIIAGIIIWLSFNYWSFTKTNIQEVEKIDLIQIQTDKLLLLEKEIDQQLRNQKELREKINQSIEKVREIEKEREIIRNKKIELAQ